MKYWQLAMAPEHQHRERLPWGYQYIHPGGKPTCVATVREKQAREALGEDAIALLTLLGVSPEKLRAVMDTENPLKELENEEAVPG